MFYFMLRLCYVERTRVILGNDFEKFISLCYINFFILTLSIKLVFSNIHLINSFICCHFGTCCSSVVIL